jgi:hypothetical protein
MAAAIDPLNLPPFFRTKLPRRRLAHEHELAHSLAGALTASETAHSSPRTHPNLGCYTTLPFLQHDGSNLAPIAL